MAEYLDHITDVNDVQDAVNDLALKMYNNGKEDTISEFKTYIKFVCYGFRAREGNLVRVDVVEKVLLEHLEN